MFREKIQPGPAERSIRMKIEHMLPSPLGVPVKRSLQTLLLFFATSLIQLHAQTLEPFGLPNKSITAMHLYSLPRLLYAATANEGVFRRDLSNDSGWVDMNTPAQNLNAIHAFHTFCPLRCWKGILVGATPGTTANDSALIYFYQQRPDSCPQSGKWTPSDSGFARTTINQINAFAGSAVCFPIGPEFVTVFAGGSEVVARSLDRGKSWQPVWQNSNAEVLALFSHRRNAGMLSSTVKEVLAEESIWAGGALEENGVRRPFISYSFDFGKTWQERSPKDFSGFSCRALAVSAADTNVMFAALEQDVLKSTDGGLHWTVAQLPDLIVQFHALALNPFDPQHVLAGGTLNGQYFLLYESRDGGEHWNMIPAPFNAAGVSSIAFDPTPSNESGMPQHLYLATYGSGVYRYTFKPTHVETTASATPRDFQLSPAFPNPSKLSQLAQLAFQISAPHAEEIRVRLRNALGQELQTWNVRLASGAQTLRLALDTVKLNSGVYFIQIEAHAFQQALKWTIVE